MRPTYLFTALLLFIFSCAPLQSVKQNKAPIPTLGTIGKEAGSLLGKDFQYIGKPHITQALSLSVYEVSFTRSTFKDYVKFKVQRDEKLAFRFVDSLPKPSYINLELSDKIALQTLLNQSENSDVRSYLTKDADYNMVTSISMVLSPRLKNEILESKTVFLTETKEGQLSLSFLENEETVVIQPWEAEIFDYKLSGFCWGKDRYGQKKIEAIAINGERCPRGTENKAYKLDETKSYLKL